MIRVAIVGAGIGAEHLSGYRALPDQFRVVAMCDTNKDRAARATGGDPRITLLADFAEVLADTQIDLIDICHRVCLCQKTL